MKTPRRRRAPAGSRERHLTQASVPEDIPGRDMAVHDNGRRLLVSLRVTPRASREAIVLEGDTLHVRLAAPPVEGAANEALIALLASRLRLPKRAITLTHGAAARHKTVAVEGISAVEFWERLGV